MPKELFQLLHWNQSGVSARILPGLLEFVWNFNRLHKSTGIYNPKGKIIHPREDSRGKVTGGSDMGFKSKTPKYTLIFEFDTQKLYL